MKAGELQRPNSLLFFGMPRDFDGDVYTDFQDGGQSVVHSFHNQFPSIK